MAKLQVSQILVQGSNIDKAVKLRTSAHLISTIKATIDRQDEVLKMKDVDLERLRMVVKL